MLTPLPPLPREAAMAASLLLRLVALGSSAPEADCDAADRELDRLRRSSAFSGGPEAADALEAWHAENV